MNSMRNPCPVCQGRRKVTLRLQKPMMIHAPRNDEALAIASMEATQAKDYPCPECSPTTSEDRVALLEFGCMISSRGFDNPGYLEAAKDDIASQLAYELRKQRMVRFVVDQPVRQSFEDTKLRGTIGIVSPNVVASMQERIRANDTLVAARMAEEAMCQVRAWGSHYTGDEGSISKGQAADAIMRALGIVQEKMKKP